MHASVLTFFLTFGLAPLSAFAASYSIQDDYSGANFFNMFTFDTEDDPTHGYVNYVDSNTAQQDNLTSVSNGVVTIRSDSTSVASGRGRNSVRVTSTKQYTHGLIVLDLAHMPGSACGIWPAFWMTGPSWPNNGEIDIIEGVNYQGQNAMTMHTNGGCSMISKDCQGNQGCGTQAGGSASYGDGFNQGNGGVYAMEWTTAAINIWFFPRSSIHSGVTGDSPDPSTWGNPIASFQGGSGCTIDNHFQNNNIVFDTTFCGDWAGQVWGSDATCSSKAATCQDYVANNPSAFSQAYWEINSLKVYSQGSGSAAKAASPSPSPAPQPQPQPQPVSAPIKPPSSPIAAPVPSSTPPTPPPSSWTGNAAVGTDSHGVFGENPAQDNQGLRVGSDGHITENPQKQKRDERELRAVGASILEGEKSPSMTRGVVKKGSLGRYLGRRRVRGFGHMRS